MNIFDAFVTINSLVAVMSALSKASYASDDDTYDDMLRLAKLHLKRSKVPFAIVSPDEKVIMCNAQMEAFLGRSQAQLQELKFSEFTHPDFVEDDVRYFRKLLRPTLEFSEYKLWKIWMRPDNSFAKGNLEAYPIMLRGEVVFVIAIVYPDESDTSLKKMMEEEKERLDQKNSRNIFIQAVYSLIDVGKLIKDDKNRGVLAAALIAFMLTATVCVFLILSRDEFWALLNAIFAG